MKKLTLFVLVVLMAGGAGATCIEFDNFCDRLRVNQDINTPGSLVGFWENWDCLGSDEPAVGSLGGGLGTFCSGDLFGEDQPYCFRVDPGRGDTCTFELYRHNGIAGNRVITIQENQPCTITPGSCPDSAYRGDRPSLLGAVE